MELATRAYAAFEVKAISAEKRTFSGWATTPSMDRVGDTINPMGVSFKNPLTLLHGHKHELPIGTATFKAPTKKGVEFDAEVPVIDEEFATLRDRVNTAWGELKYKLVRAVSIGFKPIKYAFTDEGVDYQEIEVYELSIVAIPALPDAVITAVKSMQSLTPDMVKLLRNADKRGIPLIKARAGSLSRGAVELIRR